MVRGRRGRAPKTGEEVSYASPKRKDSKLENIGKLANGVDMTNQSDMDITKLPSPPTTRSKVCNLNKDKGVQNNAKLTKNSHITSYFHVVSPTNGVQKDLKTDFSLLNGSLQPYFNGTRIEDRDYSEENGFHTFGMDRYMGFDEIKNIIHNDETDRKKDILNNIFKKDRVPVKVEQLENEDKMYGSYLEENKGNGFVDDGTRCDSVETVGSSDKEDALQPNVRLSPRKHASTLQRCVTVKENVKTPHRIRLCESLCSPAPSRSLQQLSLKPYRKRTRRRINIKSLEDTLLTNGEQGQNVEPSTDNPSEIIVPALPLDCATIQKQKHCALSTTSLPLHTHQHSNNNIFVQGADKGLPDVKQNGVVCKESSGFKQNGLVIKNEHNDLKLNGIKTEPIELKTNGLVIKNEQNGYNNKQNGIVAKDLNGFLQHEDTKVFSTDEGIKHNGIVKGNRNVAVNGNGSHKLTEYFPVRRSVRKTKKEVLEEKQRSIEMAIMEGREEGLEVAVFDGKGRGVIAARRFRRGEFVVEYAGELVSVTEARQREIHYAQDAAKGCYMYYFRFNNHHYCIDATAESGRLGRLVNHSRNGNLITKPVMFRHCPHLVLLAGQDIEPGTELTYDYGDRSKESLIAHPWLAL